MNSFTAVFSVTLSFRNHYNMLLFCPRNSSYYYQCFMRLNILMETDKKKFTDFFINRKFERTAFLLCDIVNVFVGTFNQCNEYLGTKSSNIFQKQTEKRTDTKILKGILKGKVLVIFRDTSGMLMAVYITWLMYVTTPLSSGNLNQCYFVVLYNLNWNCSCFGFEILHCPPERKNKLSKIYTKACHVTLTGINHIFMAFTFPLVI